MLGPVFRMATELIFVAANLIAYSVESESGSFSIELIAFWTA